MSISGDSFATANNAASSPIAACNLLSHAALSASCAAICAGDGAAGCLGTGLGVGGGVSFFLKILLSIMAADADRCGQIWNAHCDIYLSCYRERKCRPRHPIAYRSVSSAMNHQRLLANTSIGGACRAFLACKAHLLAIYATICCGLSMRKKMACPRIISRLSPRLHIAVHLRPGFF